MRDRRDRAAPTPESVELAKKRLAQAKARLDALNARIATEGRRLDTRRKIILGGLLLDAATKDQRFAGIVTELTHRISRDQDRKPFEGWTLPGEDR
ncbi:mobilization protein [Croceicoccus sp. 1NDH52]|nr:mobilization protein [Croceicoccus gelatinilyticus]